MLKTHVDFSAFQRRNLEVEERRLMPRYVEAQRIAAAPEVGLRVEPRADGLWRVEHVLADLRSERLRSAQKVGKAESSYRKVTFHKHHLEQDAHLDAVLIGPGHPLYAAVDEKLNERLAGLIGGAGFFVDPLCEEPYIYFVTFRTSNLEIRPDARQLVVDALRHFDGQRYTLWAATVMSDHVHLLLQPKEIEPGQWWSLSSILHSIKSFTAKEINKLLTRKSSVWQGESFDRIVRDEGEFLEKWNYIRNNPVKKGLCRTPEKWDDFYEYTGKMPVPPKMPMPPDRATYGYLVPVAYLWTRTVRCKNPSCGATVPLVRQTWLCKKKDRYVALKMLAPKAEKQVRFEVVERSTEQGFGFDPADFSKGGNATCPFCGTVADSGYVKTEGQAGHLSQHQLMAIVCTRPGSQGKVYLAADKLPSPSGRGAGGEGSTPDDAAIRQRIEALAKRTGLTVPSEPMPKQGTLGFRVQPYDIRTWGDLFTPRQMLCLLTFAAAVREAEGEMRRRGYDEERVKAVGTFLALIVDRLADFNSCQRVHNYFGSSGIAHTFGRQALPMVWDFAEAQPFNEGSGGWGADAIVAALASSIFLVARKREGALGCNQKWELH